MGEFHAKTRHWKSPRIRRPASISEISVLNMFSKNEKCIILSMRLCNDALSTLTLPLSKCSSLMKIITFYS